MTTKPASSKKPSTRQIVGFSLPPKTAAEVKTEAAKRNTTLRELFLEMWDLYKSKKTL